MVFKYLLEFQFISIIFLLTFQRANLDNKLNIEVLFESLCPDSLDFINHQLYPNWSDIAPYVNLKLVPFGKSASSEEGKKFACQHGPQECKGNRIMSCALQRLPDQNLQVEFVKCFMDFHRIHRNNERDYGFKCAEHVGLDSNELLNCYLTREGTLHQLQAEQDTRRITPTFVPTILYEGQLIQRLQDASLIDFKGVVCELIQAKFPEACQ